MISLKPVNVLVFLHSVSFKKHQSISYQLTSFDVVQISMIKEDLQHGAFLDLAAILRFKNLVFVSTLVGAIESSIQANTQDVP